MRKLLRSYRFWVFVLLVAAGATWALWPQRQYPFTVSPDTTYLTGPLHPDGTVNYVAALNERFSKGVTPENNAAPLLLRAWGAKMIPFDVRDKMFEILQMEPVPEKGLMGTDPEEIVEQIWSAAAAKGATTKPDWYDLEDRALNAPWTVDDLPAVARWLGENERMLAVIGEAVKRPRLYIPLVSTSDSPCLLTVGFCRYFGCSSTMRMFIARAMGRLGSGDIEGACADLLTAHRLVRLVGQGPLLTPKLISFAMEEVACAGDLAAARSGKLSAAQAKRFRRQLDGLSPITAPVEAVLFERLCALDVASEYRRTGKAVILPFGVTWSPSRPVDWDRELREINAWFNRCEEVLGKANYADSVAAFRAFEPDYRKLCAGVEPGWDFARVIREITRKLPMARTRPAAPLKHIRGRMGEVLVAMILPVRAAFQEFPERCSMRLEITKLALALAAYRMEKGHLPVKLKDMMPEYVNQIPEDTFVGRPLIYRRIGKEYLLHSVGPNMTDDGGKEFGSGGEDDIAVRAK